MLPADAGPVREEEEPWAFWSSWHHHGSRGKILLPKVGHCSLSTLFWDEVIGRQLFHPQGICGFLSPTLPLRQAAL